MDKKCYHFVHTNDINLASIIDEDKNSNNKTEKTGSKKPEIISASLDKKSN